MKYYFQCPHCGNDDEFLRPTDGNSTGCAIFFLGGLIPALIFDNYMKRRVQCLKCLHTFQQPPIPSSTAANFSSVLQLVIILLIAAAYVFHMDSDLGKLLPPDVPILSMIEDAIAAQPRATAYLLVTLVFVVSVGTVIAASVGNRRMRQLLSLQYRLKPPASIKAARGGDGEAMPPPKQAE